MVSLMCSSTLVLGLCSAALFAPFPALAATGVTDDVTSDTMWTADASPYLVSSDTSVTTGAVLTVEPGVVVELGPGITLTVAGTLLVEGSAAAPVVFTSVDDSPESAGWRHIIVAGGATASFVHAALRYGGTPPGASGGDLVPPLPGVIESEGTLTFTDSIIENTVLAGGIASTGSLVFTRSTIGGTDPRAHALSLSGSAELVDSAFAAGEAILATDANLTLTSMTLDDPVDIEGHASGHDGGGNTAPIILAWRGNLDADTTFPVGPFINTPSSVSVASGATLSVAPGAIVKSYDPIDVYGTLVVGAPGDATTILTSAADDSAGGDTNPGDGDSSPTDPDYAFAGILAEEGSAVTIKKTEIRYAGEAYGSYLPTPCAGDPDAPQDACAAQVSNFGGTLTVASSTFNRATYNDFLIDDGTTVITGSRFSDSPRFALMRGGTFSASGNSITDTTGVLNESGAAMDARNNWWGTASGPHEAVSNPGGTGPEVSGGVLYNPWLATDPFAPVATPDGVSNVLFLPGTEASRLYYRDGLGIEHQVWEPNFRTDIPYLAMNTDGSSTYPLYTKDIIERMTANSLFESSITRIFGANLEVYKGFQGYMDTLVADGTIEEWRGRPHDLGYEVPGVGGRGPPPPGPRGGGRQVYLADVLRQMASSSASGKVTIVAHSNGGLLAKALASSLGGDASRYIDRIVMVGTPQWGTPAATGALLHADN